MHNPIIYVGLYNKLYLICTRFSNKDFECKGYKVHFSVTWYWFY